LTIKPLLRFAALALFALATPLSAKDSLGVFGDWGAFRDRAAPSTMRRDYEPYASIGTWPKRSIRGQLHLRLSRRVSAASAIVLRIGTKQYTLAGGGGDAWAEDKRMDAAIVSAMRSARSMNVSARDDRGVHFSNTYTLQGAATAMDAATIGCAKLH
jgi:hypothetical protein